MITVDESKFKRSDVTLYDKDGNIVAIAKNVLVTEDDDLLSLIQAIQNITNVNQ